MATVTWKSLVQNNAVTIPDGDTVTDLPASPSDDYGTVDSITLSGSATLKGPGSVTTQKFGNSPINLTLDGATLRDNESKITAGTINIINGGNFTDSNASQANGITFNFGPTSSSVTNSLYIQPYIASGVTINNVAPGDNIYFIPGYSISGVKLVDGNAGVVYVRDSNNNTLGTLNVAKNSSGSYYRASDFQIANPSSNTYEVVCFLAGSLIRTPNGERPVETIVAGDLIETFDWRNNHYVARAAVWAGRAHMTVNSALPDDEAGYPVCVRKDAIADGVPFEDLLVTADHSLFFDGKFVPVRMLVNGHSIAYDRSITSYDYYHVETEQHAAITANGLLTESYLDTGNRASFRELGSVVGLGVSRHLSWETDAGAALTVDRALVEPLFRKIAARASLVAAQNLSHPEQTNDPELHLMTQDGRRINSIAVEGQRTRFMIPAGVETVWIASRSSRPFDAIGPFVDDRRFLGVLVGEITVTEFGQARRIGAHLSTEAGPGWANQEAAPCRWTTGRARLDLGSHADNCLAELTIEVLAAGPYVHDRDIFAEQPVIRVA